MSIGGAMGQRKFAEKAAQIRAMKEAGLKKPKLPVSAQGINLDLVLDSHYDYV
jgi:hypothetical protein